MNKKINIDIKIILGVFIGFFVALVVSLTNNFGIFDKFELNMLDMRFKAFNKYKEKPNEDIIIVGVDDFSVAQIGRWPWNREEHAKIVDFLNLYGAKAIIFDVFFDHKDLNNPESDEKFIKAVEKFGNVYSAAKFISLPDTYKQDPKKLIRNKMFNSLAKGYFEIPAAKATDTVRQGKNLGLQIPFDGLEQVTKKYGTVYVGEVDDDKIRYQNLLYEHEGNFYTSLALTFALDYLKENNLFTKKRKIPVDEKNRVVINWKARGNEKKGGFLPPYNQYPAWRFIQSYDQIIKASEACGVSPEKFKEMLDNPEELYPYIDKIPEDFELKFGGHNPTELFKDKIVFIGIASTSTTVRDIASTPFFKEIPGVYILANMVDNLLKNDFLVKVHKPVTIIIIFVLGILCSLSVFCLKNSLVGVLTPIFISIIYIFTAIMGFIKFHYWIDIFYTELTLILTFAISVSIYYILEGREKAQIKKAMSNYIAPQIMNEVLSDPSKLKLGGSRKELSILFSDIKGFTTISENNSPEQVVSMLNEYFDLMVHIIIQNQGTFDKFIGDAVMAFWNAPLSIEDHAFLAVKSAWEMQRAVDILSFKWKLKQDDFSIRIGINTAEVIVGNVGSDKIKDYTIIGDGVNIASRLEGLNKEYGTKIIISEYTYLKIKDRIETRYLGESKLKGKDKLINIYEVINIKG
ncbi:MAG: hypothetical protein A2Y25_05895 [Candidatus Melainabacteria bacterium GWF2_37_15]|nr:MAG: hypothetical protein A2Y25_05895 [Candidatus Melainabacteria bacterium GWF2_37_15]